MSRRALHLLGESLTVLDALVAGNGTNPEQWCGPASSVKDCVRDVVKQPISQATWQVLTTDFKVGRE